MSRGPDGIDVAHARSGLVSDQAAAKEGKAKLRAPASGGGAAALAAACADGLGVAEVQPALRSTILLGLQRTAGNAAVASWVGGARGQAIRPRPESAPHTRGAVQRTPEWLKDGQRDFKVTRFAEAVERRVLSAYGFLVANPSLGAHATLASQDKDGHIGLWLRMWEENKQGMWPWQMFHAQAGYAIESLATFLSLQDAPAGTTAKAQVTVGNTRPDLVLYDTATGNTLCWLDITARHSIGHVAAKAGNWFKPGNAEILYPSFTDSDFEEMRTNDDDTGKPMQMNDDVRLLLALGMTRNRIELEEQELRRDHFVTNYASKAREALKNLTAAQKRTRTVKWMQENLDSNLTLKPIANMLYAARQSVSVFFPETTSNKVPTGLSRREGDTLLAQFAQEKGWNGVTLPDDRRKEIRLEVEQELFQTSVRTRKKSVYLEEGLEEQRGQKRGRPDDTTPGGQPPPLKRARSDVTGTGATGAPSDWLGLS